MVEARDVHARHDIHTVRESSPALRLQVKTYVKGSAQPGSSSGQAEGTRELVAKDKRGCALLGTPP